MPPALKKSDFHYELPPELIAQAPLAERSASRLLVVPPGAAASTTAACATCPSYLQPGDLLVFNDTRVIPARLFGNKDTGGRVEILLERMLRRARGAGADRRQQVAASRAAASRSMTAAKLTVLGREGEFYRLRFDIGEPLEKLLLRAGRMPLPPYIQREAGADDAERYQTVFARDTGAVAAPTAGLHFDERAAGTRCASAACEFGHVTLHVGAGTFQPMRAERRADHRMHSEWLNVGAELVRAGRAHARRRRPRDRGRHHRGARAGNARCATASVQPFAGDTRIFIFPGFRFRSVDALLTNFHLPECTLLMLVSAFAGTRAHPRRLRACGARALPVLLLRRRDVAVSAAGAPHEPHVVRAARPRTARRAAAA